MKAYVNSIETMGMVDGPGIRAVIFFSGCRLRCSYCHNPEAWVQKEEDLIECNELMHQILKYKDYYQNGGVTFSGGEPLLQNEALIEMLKLCKGNNLHTAIDTSGVGDNNYDEILSLVDLVILDIKDYREVEYFNLTGQSMKEFNNFLNTLNESQKPVWIRQVIIPNVNDNKEYILGLKEYLKNIFNIEKIELLPYHSLGKEKYAKLNLDYPLKDIKDVTAKEIKDLEKFL